MVRVACLLMQKNEDSLLAQWIAYHSDLFGIENLYVFDNGSTSSSVIEELQRAESKGLNVDRSNSESGVLNRKHLIFSDLMARLDEGGRYDFYIPLDCDEFLVKIIDNDSFSADRNVIRDYFRTVGDEPRLMKVGTNLSNILSKDGRFWKRPYSKVIFSPGSFVASDLGFHAGVSRRGSGQRDLELAYVHYHYRPFPELLEFSKAKLSGRVDVTDMQALSKYNGPGWHLVQYFIEGAESYYRQFRRSDGISFNEIVDRFHQLGHGAPYEGFELPSVPNL